LANRDYRNIIQDFSALGFLPADIDAAKYQPNFATAFDNVLSRGAKNVAFSDVTQGLIAATLDMPFGLPEYFALILRMVGTLEGIAVQADESWIFVDAAFPFVAKKMIMEESSKDILQEMIVDNNGKLSLTRISLLLESFESFSEKNTRSVGSGLYRNEEKDDQILAEKIRDSLLFFFSDEGKNLRDLTE
jgi:predicted unusual protein kinase regulating ubiquinone biosynthesis (AarF/ABC1/UbiB family)